MRDWKGFSLDSKLMRLYDNALGIISTKYFIELNDDELSKVIRYIVLSSRIIK